jgi:hypothetical protein
MPRALRSRGIRSSALKNAVARTVREIFAGESFGLKQISKFVFPSTSANYINSRGFGGSVPIVKEEYELWKSHYANKAELDIDGDLTDFHKEYNEFSISQEKTRVWKEWTKDKLRFYEINGERRDYYCSGEWIEKTRLRIHDPSWLEQESLEFYHYLVRRCMTEESLVTPQALAEALKVRVITKCPPLLMYVIKPIQKWMSEVLRKLSVFRLTGEEISPQVVNQAFGTLTDGMAYLSGDYSDATNNLMKEYSDIVAEELGSYLNVEYFDDHLNDCLRTLLKRSLTGFSMHGADILRRFDIYKMQNKGESFDDVFAEVLGNVVVDSSRVYMQQDGQLMGSVSSFCVLFIINAAICRYCLEWDSGKTLLLKECRLLINGDDCVFEIGPFGHELWKIVCPMVGLKPSIGKYYYSKDFLQMNSRTFVPCSPYLLDGELSVWKSIPFVLYGLVCGNGRTSGSTPLDFGSQYNEFMSTAPEHLRQILHNRAIKIWQARVRKFNINLDSIPWYLPTCYGGLGLDPRFTGRKISDKDKRMISYMRERHVCPPPTNESEWIIYRNVMSLYPERTLVWSDEKSEDAIRFNNYLMQQMFFISRIEPGLNTGQRPSLRRNAGAVGGVHPDRRRDMFFALGKWWRSHLKSKNLRFEPFDDPYEKRERLMPLVEVGYFNGSFNDFSCVWNRAEWL